jgi:type VI secretion system protein ImpJ
VLGAARQCIEAAPELGLRASNGYVLFAIEAPDSMMQGGEQLVVSNNNETYASLRPQELVLFVKGTET